MLRSDRFISGFRFWTVSVGFIALLILHAQAIVGQEVTLERDYVFLTIDADLKALKSEPRLGLLPWEIYSSFVKRLIGIDMLAEESVQMSFAFREGDNWLMAIASTRSSEMSLTDLAKRRFTVVKDAENAKREDLRRVSDSEILVQKADHVWYVGTMQTFNVFADANRWPIPTRFAVAEDPKPILSVVLKTPPIRDELLLRIEMEFDDQEDPEVVALIHLIHWIEEARLEILPGSPLSIRLTIQGVENLANEKIMDEIRILQQPNVNYLEQYIQRKVASYRLSQREQFAWEAYVARLKQSLSETDARIEEGKIRYDLSSLLSVPFAALFGQGLIETLELKRLSNERFSSQYKLREVNEAIEKYTKEKGSFPLREIQSEDGESLLSWRVALLPYLGYESLYNKFHLNEPWNSPHNLALVKEMPSIYRNSEKHLAEGYTTFVAPYGATDAKRKTVWDIVPKGLSEVSEEEQGSILLVEVNGEAAVPWSSPDDFNISLQDLRTVLRDPPEGNGVVFLDGNTDHISNAISTVTLLELLNCSMERKP